MNKIVITIVVLCFVSLITILWFQIASSSKEISELKIQNNHLTLELVNTKQELLETNTSLHKIEHWRDSLASIGIQCIRQHTPK